MAKRKRGGGSCLTRVNKAVLLLSAALAAERDRAFWMVGSWFGRQMDGAGKEEAARIFRQKRQLERELDSGCKKLLRRFFQGLTLKSCRCTAAFWNRRIAICHRNWQRQCGGIRWPRCGKGRWPRRICPR